MKLQFYLRRIHFKVLSLCAYVQVSLFAELFNEMLQRDFGYRIYKALASLPVKDDKKEKKIKKEMEKKEAEKRDSKKEKEDESEEPNAKKSKEDEEDKKKVIIEPLRFLVCVGIVWNNQCVFHFVQSV